MKKTIGMLILAVVACAGLLQETALAQNPSSDCPSFNLNVLGGRKELSNDWKPANEQDEFGGEIDFAGRKWPIALAVGYLYATQKGTADQILNINNVNQSFTNLERQSKTEELYLGLKKIWTANDVFSFFLSGGASSIKGTLQFPGASIQNQNFDETKIGWYGSTGFYGTVFNFLNIGIMVRYSDTKLTLVNQDLNAGGWHYLGMAGIHF